jgi:hypothetical protein
MTSNSDEASGQSNRGGAPHRVVTSEESEEEALRRAIEESEKEAKNAAAL